MLAPIIYGWRYIHVAPLSVSNTYTEVQNIGAILDVIRHVAKQTNLPGLNAAIEASRSFINKLEV